MCWSWETLSRSVIHVGFDQLCFSCGFFQLQILLWRFWWKQHSEAADRAEASQALSNLKELYAIFTLLDLRIKEVCYEQEVQHNDTNSTKVMSMFSPPAGHWRQQQPMDGCSAKLSFLQQKYQKRKIHEHVLLKFSAPHTGGHWTCRGPLCFGVSAEQKQTNMLVELPQ